MAHPAPATSSLQQEPGSAGGSQSLLSNGSAADLPAAPDREALDRGDTTAYIEQLIAIHPGMKRGVGGGGIRGGHCKGVGCLLWLFAYPYPPRLLQICLAIPCHQLRQCQDLLLSNSSSNNNSGLPPPRMLRLWHPPRRSRTLLLTRQRIWLQQCTARTFRLPWASVGLWSRSTPDSR